MYDEDYFRGMQGLPPKDAWASPSYTHGVNASKNSGTTAHDNIQAAQGLASALGVVFIFMAGAATAPVWIPYLIHRHLAKTNLDRARKFKNAVLWTYGTTTIAALSVIAIAQTMSAFSSQRGQGYQAMPTEDVHESDTIIQSLLQQTSEEAHANTNHVRQLVRDSIQQAPCQRTVMIRDIFQFGSITPATAIKLGNRCAEQGAPTSVNTQTEEWLVKGGQQIVIEHHATIYPISPYSGITNIRQFMSRSQQRSGQCAIVQFSTNAATQGRYEYRVPNTNTYIDCSLGR